jgi:transposase
MLHQKSGDSAMALVSPCTSTEEIGQAAPEANSDTTASTARRIRPAPGTAGSVRITGPYAPETRGRFGGDLHDLAATAPAKRRIFSAEEKARIVAESFKPGESVCSVARRHHLMSSQLFSWRKHARLQRKQEGFGDSGANATVMQGTGRFDPASSSSKQAATIEIAIGTTIVRVPEGADAATLRAVLRALNETS